MRAGVIADIHRRDGNEGDVDEELGRIVDHMNEEFRPDVVVALGDLIQHSDRESDISHLNGVKTVLDGLDAPVRYLPGNHDVMNLSREGFAEITGQELFGLEEVAGQDVLFLDSSAPWLSGSRGELSEDQLAFLREELPEADDAVVFVHHPLHYHNVESNVWWDNYPERALCGNKKEFNRIVEENPNVRLAVNAHLHELNQTFYAGYDHFTVGPFAKWTPGEGVSGLFAELVVEDDVSMHIRTVESDIHRYTGER